MPQLREYGFDAFAIDLVDGPEDVLAYLCADQNLHMIVSRLLSPLTGFR